MQLLRDQEKQGFRWISLLAYFFPNLMDRLDMLWPYLFQNRRFIQLPNSPLAASHTGSKAIIFVGERVIGFSQVGSERYGMALHVARVPQKTGLSPNGEYLP